MSIRDIIEWSCGCGDSLPTDIKAHVVWMEGVVQEALKRRRVGCPLDYVPDLCRPCSQRYECEAIHLLATHRRERGLG